MICFATEACNSKPYGFWEMCDRPTASSRGLCGLRAAVETERETETHMLYENGRMYRCLWT